MQSSIQTILNRFLEESSNSTAITKIATQTTSALTAQSNTIKQFSCSPHYAWIREGYFPTCESLQKAITHLTVCGAPSPNTACVRFEDGWVQKGGFKAIHCGIWIQLREDKGSTQLDSCLCANMMIDNPSSNKELRIHERAAKQGCAPRILGRFPISNTQTLVCVKLYEVGELGKIYTLSWETQKRLILSLTSQLKTLHKTLRIAHRDIKRANILLTREWQRNASPQLQAIMNDYGLSVDCNSSMQQIQEHGGTWEYCSPEKQLEIILSRTYQELCIQVFTDEFPEIPQFRDWIQQAFATQKEAPQQDLSDKAARITLIKEQYPSDIYAMGRTLFEMTHQEDPPCCYPLAIPKNTGFHSFMSTKLAQFKDWHQNQVELAKDNPRDLIFLQMIHPDPRQRITAEQALDALQIVEEPAPAPSPRQTAEPAAKQNCCVIL